MVPLIPYRYQARFVRAVLILSVILAAVILAWLVLESLTGQRVWFAPAEPETSAEAADSSHASGKPGALAV